MIVAIDGHAGSGKSSLGKRLAREYGMLYIDTGAMYRAVALHFVRHGLQEAQAQDIEESLEAMGLECVAKGDEFDVLLEGQRVNDELRAREVSQMASRIARLEPVRRYLTDLQRSFAAQGDLVVDGRDIGTVVFPQADLKIFLTADTETRAQRRHLDQAGGRGETVHQTREEIVQRDQADSNRTISPLVRAEDAVLIDTTDLDETDVYDTVRALISQV